MVVGPFYIAGFKPVTKNHVPGLKIPEYGGLGWKKKYKLSLLEKQFDTPVGALLSRALYLSLPLQHILLALVFVLFSYSLLGICCLPYSGLHAIGGGRGMTQGPCL